MAKLTEHSSIALGLVATCIGIAITAGNLWGALNTSTSLRLDALEKDAAQSLAIHNADIEWKQSVKDDLRDIKDQLKRLHYTVKKAASAEVASRKTEDSKLRCSLYTTGPFSMNESGHN